MDLITRMTASGDYVSLPHHDAYAVCFNQIARVCSIIQKWAEPRVGSKSPEAATLKLFQHRILQSFELLRLKCLNDPEHTMKLDLNRSGFPHFNELQKLVSDRERAEEMLLELPPRTMLVEQSLDELFRRQAPPEEYLSVLGRRMYLEKLLESDFLGPYRFGGLHLIETEGDFRRYVCAWGCYAPRENLPYLHLLHFDQDKRARPLNPGAPEYEAFKEMLEREGRRVPPLAVLATAIDTAFETIHPKALRRLRIGPVLLNSFSFDEGPLADFLRFDGHPDDLIFSLESEVIVSSKQVVKEKGSLFRPDKVREIFEISDSDLECFDRKLSEIHRFLFMPHRLWQLTLDRENPPWMQGFADAYRFSFDDNNEVHEL